MLNRAWKLAQIDQVLCLNDGTAEALSEVEKRLHPDNRVEENQPHGLVADGRLTVPVMQVWSRSDAGQCGETPMACPLPDGSTVTMGSVDCMHELLRAAIAAQGPTSRSTNTRLCVDGANPGNCDRHTPTNSPGAVNTDPAFPAAFNPVIMDWIHARIADD